MGSNRDPFSARFCLLCILTIFNFQQKLLSFILFADDSSVFFSHRNPQTLLQTVNSDVTLWIHANKLSLNLKKTNYMLYSNSLSILPGNVMFNGVEIERVSTFKFLGLHIDEHFNWKDHIY